MHAEVGAASFQIGLRPSFIRILRGLETGVVPEGKNRPPVFSERVVAREYRPGSVRPGEGGKRRKGNGESDSDDDWVEMRSSRPQQSGDACAAAASLFWGRVKSVRLQNGADNSGRPPWIGAKSWEVGLYPPAHGSPSLAAALIACGGVESRLQRKGSRQRFPAE